MLKLGRIAACSLHLWKGEMKIARMATFSKNISQIFDEIASNAKRQIAPLTGKSIIFEKLQGLIGETLDRIIREEENKGISVTKEDLVGCAEQLDKEGKYGYALEIFEWMEKEKMEFNPSELALFVDLIAKTQGVAAANLYFRKLDPDFDQNTSLSKNWPAFHVIRRHLYDGFKKSGQKLAVRRFRNGVLQ